MAYPFLRFHAYCVSPQHSKAMVIPRQGLELELVLAPLIGLVNQINHLAPEREVETARLPIPTNGSIDNKRWILSASGRLLPEIVREYSFVLALDCQSSAHASWRYQDSWLGREKYLYDIER